MNPSIAEIKILERLWEIRVARDEFAVNPEACCEYMGFVLGIVDRVLYYVGGSIGVWMDVCFADRRMNVGSGSYGYEAQFDCCCGIGGNGGDGAGITRDPYFISARLGRPCMIDAPIVMFSLYANGDWGERALDRVVCGLFALVIVNDGPGCAGPAIV